MDSTLLVPFHNSGLHSHPSDPFLHIFCSVGICILDRWRVSHSPGHCPQCHELADGSAVVHVSAPAPLPSSAGGTQPRSILVHRESLTHKETPTQDILWSILEIPESCEILKACIILFSLGQGRECGEGGVELIPVASRDGKCFTEHKAFSSWVYCVS